MVQWGRTYQLSVGDESEGWKIWDLNVAFEVTRNSDESNSDNTAKVTIFNLSRDKIAALQKPYMNVEFDVGYLGTNLTRLITGQIVNVEVDSQKGDTATVLYVSESFTDLNHKVISKLIPDGRKVRDVLQEVVDNTPSLDRAVFTGDAVDTAVIDGYPINETGREVLDSLAKSYKFEYTIERGVLYTSDYDKPTNKEVEAFLITPDTGLIGRVTKYSNQQQYQKLVEKDSKLKNLRKSTKPRKNDSLEVGVQFKTLLNAGMVVGGLVRIIDQSYTGVYKLKEIKYYGEFMGGDWYCDIIALGTNYE